MHQQQNRELNTSSIWQALVHILIIWNLIAANAAGDRRPSVRGQEEGDWHCSPENRR